MQHVCSQQSSLHCHIHPACWTSDKQGKQDNLTLSYSQAAAKTMTFNNMEPQLVTTARSDGTGARIQPRRQRLTSYLNPPHLCIQVALLYWSYE